MMLIATLTAGCGNDSASSAANATLDSASPSYPINRVPSVPGGAAMGGTPSTTAVAGQPYSFQPQVANAVTGAVHFAIQNLPSWARFNSATGLLTGTPNSSEIGQYPGISISMITGSSVVVLPMFSITVTAAALAGTVTLSWQAPTENADGTPLVDLRGYKVHFGTKSKTYSSTVQVGNPGLTTYVVQNLPAGEYYFALTSYNSAGIESSLSPEVSTQVD